VVGSEVLREGYSWLSTKLKSLISEFGEPPSLSIRGDMADVVTSNTFLGFEVLFSIGTPRLVKMLSGDSPLATEMSMVISIRMNVAALTHLFGRGAGSWRVDFGIYLQGLPSSLFGDAFSEGETAHLWLIRGSALQTA
jgi:hypothetical protein